jgi:hypothetical protein
MKSLKKGVGSRVGSGSISKRYGSGDPDPESHQKVTGPQHWFPELNILYYPLIKIATYSFSMRTFKLREKPATIQREQPAH